MVQFVSQHLPKTCRFPLDVSRLIEFVSQLLSISSWLRSKAMDCRSLTLVLVLALAVPVMLSSQQLTSACWPGSQAVKTSEPGGSGGGSGGGVGSITVQPDSARLLAVKTSEPGGSGGGSGGGVGSITVQPDNALLLAVKTSEPGGSGGGSGGGVG